MDTNEKPKWTPGPRVQVIRQPGTMLTIEGKDGEYVCSLLGSNEGKKRNAAILAAAPDMAALLEELTAKATDMNNLQHAGISPNAGDWSDIHAMTNRARALLAKIDGRE